MMSGLKRNLFGALLLALGVTGQASAQTQGIIDCDFTWNSGKKSKVSIKIDGNKPWMWWNSDSWSWVPYECNEGRSYFISSGTVCNYTADSSFFKRTFSASENRDRLWDKSYNGEMLINRNAGTIAIRNHFYGYWVPQQKERSESESADGTCKAIPDPALQPRPKPKF